MHNFTFVTLFTPTPENYNGPSALCYYLIAKRPSNIRIEIFSFNINQVPNDMISRIENILRAKIRVIPLPFWFRLIKNPKQITFFQFFLNLPLLHYLKLPNKIIEEIKECKPDCIWWYPSEFFYVPESLIQFKHIVTGPDCASLTPFRRLQQPWLYEGKFKKWVYFKILDSTLRMERNYQACNSLLHVVGMEDAFLLQKIQPNMQVFFLLHPHYQIIKNPQTKFQQNPIKVLFAGKKSSLNENETKSLIILLAKNTDKLSQNYSFTFLGKGWKEETEYLRRNGYRCNYLDWVDNYVESIAQFDIQISLLTIGAGTKGKVLDALSNGLLVIGSKVSLENIAVRNYDSCIVYKHLNEIIQILKRIPFDIQRYKTIAFKGMKQVRTYHSPERISKRFFDIVCRYFEE